jgi:hypothetical protein
MFEGGCASNTHKTAQCGERFPETLEFSGGRAMVFAPIGVTVEQNDKGDFDLLTFQDPTGVLMGGYVGNFPSAVVAKNQNSSVTKERYGRYVARTYATIDGEGKTRETTIALKDSGWPMFVQFFYSGLPEERASVADKIICSFRFEDR